MSPVQLMMLTASVSGTSTICSIQPVVALRILFILSVFGYKNSACCQAQEGLRLWIMVTSFDHKENALKRTFQLGFRDKKTALFQTVSTFHINFC